MISVSLTFDINVFVGQSDLSEFYGRTLSYLIRVLVIKVSCLKIGEQITWRGRPLF